MAQLLAQRHHDVARLERPARRARQQRRVEHEVDVVDERHARPSAAAAAARACGRRRGRRSRRRGSPRPRPCARGYRETSSANRSAATLPPEIVTPDAQPARLRHAPGEQRGDRARAARLGDRLAALEQEAHRGDDLLVVGHARSPATWRLTTSKVSSPGIGSCWPSAIVRGTSIAHALAGLQRAPRVVARLGLDADHPRVRRDRRRAAMAQPAISPPPPTHTSSTSSGARLLEQLERDRPLPGHHALVVVGVDRDRAPRSVDEPGEQPLAVDGVAVEEDHLGAVAAGGRELAGRRVLGHQDRRAGVVQPGGERERLRVVAGRDGGDARGRAPRRERGDRVVRAAELERADALEVLGLQEDRRAASPRRARAR